MATKYKGSNAEKQALDVFIKLARAHDSVDQALRGYFRDIDLTPPQFGILETLYHLGPMQQCQLASKLLKSAGNITRILDTLQVSGLIERLPEPGDRRAYRIHLTAKGTKLVEKIFPQFARSVQELFAGLDNQEQQDLGRLLRKLGKQSTHSLIE